MKSEKIDAVLARTLAGERLSHEEALALTEHSDLSRLMDASAQLCEQGHAATVSYSRKVFVPLTQLCRDVCHYCTFARPPQRGVAPYLTPEHVLAIARAGARAGCKEALFTLGDKPELRYRVAREALAALGHDNTLSYLAEMAQLVYSETGLLPHLNPGVMTATDISALRAVSVSQGLMLESAAPRLCMKGGPHHGSPDKEPARRLETIRLAGEAAVPFTTGILIGIGETRSERIEALLVLRDLHERYGHIQEIIVQNFRAKQGTRMAGSPEPALEEHQWTISVARLLFGSQMNIQAPPNLRAGALEALLRAGINDWGGVSPVTPDFVNPEAPWPEVQALAAATRSAGRILTERLAIYPRFARNPEVWLDRKLVTSVRCRVDAEGYARSDVWSPGGSEAPPVADLKLIRSGLAVASSNSIKEILRCALEESPLDEAQIVRLFTARGSDFAAVCAAADRLRAQTCGEAVTYVVNRNINYTNVCYFRCRFCAFSKGKHSANLRGRPYDLSLEEIERRAREAWARGATELCMQGGIHPDYTGETYLEICRRIKAVVPDIHLHAFSPLEVWQGARTLGISVAEFLRELREAGLATLPGTAAEILDDEVRAVICPDKISTAQWLRVMETAHEVGLRSTATIMFGHVDGPVHWARHLLRLRSLQMRTGGFTEFVPLPFVHMQAPLFLKGQARAGPTFREAVLMHAVARLALHPLFTNIQTSWVKMGPAGARAALQAGANDLGGTLMNETITRSAGAVHGQEMEPEQMEDLIRSLERKARQRTTLYEQAPGERQITSFGTAPLEAVRQSPVAHNARRRRVRELVLPR